MGWSSVLVLSVLVYTSTSSLSICDYTQCNCTDYGGPWIKADCHFNSSQKQLDITSETIPKNLAELQISGPREMVLDSGSFSLNGLTFVNLSDVGVLTVGKNAFARVTSKSLRFEVRRVNRVILETNAFCEFKSSALSAILEQLGHLIVQKKAFDRLLSLDISRVGLLVLHPEAFFFEPDSTKYNGPATKITLDRVKLDELPERVFPSLNQLTITNSEVKTVKASAFQALLLTSVHLINTTLESVETEAFTTRSVIGHLEMDGVTAGLLQPNCMQSGISTLTVRGSSFREIAESAFLTPSASIIIAENVFNRVRSRGFTFKETSSLTVENNRFNALDDYAFILPERVSESGQTINMTFRGNSFSRDVGREALDFTRSNQMGTIVHNNSFDHQCHCEEPTKNWLREKINGSERVIDLFYENSLCQITLDLSRCFSLPRGIFMMENFSALACDSEGQYSCPEVVQSDAAIPSFPGTTSDIVYDTSTDRERKVLVSILIFVVSGIVLMLFLSGLMWLRRNGYCTKARLMLLPSADSVFDIISRAVVGSTAPSGVNAVPAHEYAELQQAQKLAEESAEEEIPLEDKATQTLPEELTQELLQTLREKLDDPENYSEARDMIEHLYDLIKVEESCNQNSDSISLQLEELEDLPEGENLYDVIGPKPRPKTRVPREKRSLVSVGTRAPSPDKLLPLSLSRLRPAVLCDYMEPRDRQHHVYQEITPPASSVLCDYTEPPDSKPHVYHELSMANRPLPSKPDPGEGPSSR
ncbi:uncharacterized protein LOC124369729 [Homalodisca vitripennis]|uniref:uncharacterized protein LOC124369729 n=1 Tax=Homalodisca vitripennis TaxID=197043 RepID=UPI001EEB707C|nr:uncharacterized protein LOC124369729 [Homalodisca vitripennis]